MSFPRIKSAGWGTLEKFTSTQATQLDLDHSKALNGSTDGDTLLGEIQIASTGSILINGAGASVATEVPIGINTVVASGIMSGVPGGIALGGGSTDYPIFTNGSGTASPRSFTRTAPLVTASVATGWSIFAGFYVGSATALADQRFLPTVLPTISVARYGLITGAVAGLVALSTTAIQSFTPTPANGTAWYSGGLLQPLTFVCNQANVINAAQNTYVVDIVDENGSGSFSGNGYYGFQLNYTGVANMRPQ
jgi:hypothetical protein